MIKYNIMQKKYIIIIFIALLVVVTTIFGIYKYQKKYFPIDLVYLWVDGSDEVWQQKRDYWLQQTGEKRLYSTNKSRWRDRGELKHSLRSVAQYMPWIRTIYIVTDGQVPSWLNIAHPKIKIVDHKDILPQEVLPLFNSSAIEMGIANIKGLSEHFIYTNDDIFVNAPLTPDFFFDKDGKPIYYGGYMSKKIEQKYSTREYMGDFSYEAYNFRNKTIEKILKRKAVSMNGTHTFMPHIKKDYVDMINLLKTDFTTDAKFRTTTDLFSGIISYAEILEKRYTMLPLNFTKTHFKCDPAGLFVLKNIVSLEEYNPCTFCLNDSINFTDEESQAQMDYMQQRFPNKSEFEK